MASADIFLKLGTKTKLMQAALAGDEKKVRKLLKNSRELATIDVTDELQHNALFKSFVGLVNNPSKRGNYLQIASLLLQHDVDVNKVDRRNATLAMHAAYQLDFDFLQLVLDRGADCSLQDEEGRNVLHALLQGVARLTSQSSSRSNLGASRSSQESTQTRFASNVQPNVVQLCKTLLLANRALGTQFDVEGRTVLMQAANLGLHKLVQAICEIGDEKVFATNDRAERKSVLHACVIGASQQRRNVRGGAAASQCDHLETCRVLLAHFEVMKRNRPVSLSLVTGNQRDPAALTSSTHESATANGANESGSAVTTSGSNAARPSLFVTVGNDTALEASVSKGLFELSYTDANGNTALHYAAGLGQASIVEMLLKSGAQAHVNLINARGKTALHAAFHYVLFKDLSLEPLVQLRVAKALLEAGADFQVNDADGRSPLEVAKANMDAIYVRELVDFIRERIAATKTSPPTTPTHAKIAWY